MNEDVAKTTLAGKLTQPCPMCHHKSFSIVGRTLIVLNNDPKAQLVFGGGVVPAVLVVCENCGFVAFHATKALGIE